MPIQYSYDPETKIVYTSATGEVCMDELKEYFEKLLNDDAITSGFWEVVNIEGTKNVTLTYADCKKSASLVKRIVKEKDYQGALLFAPNKLSGSIVRLLFSVLRSVLPQTFHVENDREKFKELVDKHLHINYEFNNQQK